MWPPCSGVVYQRYPTVTVVNIADVMQIVEDVVQRIATVIRFISAFTILAGAVMVASSVAGSRFRRMRDGGDAEDPGRDPPSDRMDIFSGVSGIRCRCRSDGKRAGQRRSLWVVLRRLLEVDFHPSWVTHGAAGRNRSGWSRRWLDGRPAFESWEGSRWMILREE